MTRTVKTGAVKTAHITAAHFMTDADAPAEPSGYETLVALAAEIDALPFKARAGKLPEIIRAIAEVLK